MNLSAITNNLYIGNTPVPEEYDFLRNLGVRLVINMRFEKWPQRDVHQPPLRFLWLPTIDSPGLVIPIRMLVRGVRAALQTFQEGGKVYAHCAQGRHRGVAMGAAILIALGYSANEAMTLIKTRRPLADPDVFYIRNRILRFARAWHKHA
jgi:hypothetical protein